METLKKRLTILLPFPITMFSHMLGRPLEHPDGSLKYCLVIVKGGGEEKANQELAFLSLLPGPPIIQPDLLCHEEYM